MIMLLRYAKTKSLITSYFNRPKGAKPPAAGTLPFALRLHTCGPVGHGQKLVIIDAFLFIYFCFSYSKFDCVN
jgi:hypothetical protein